ncbi:MAG: ABC transporter permease [Hyphomicrobiaceae bacterium]
MATARGVCTAIAPMVNLRALKEGLALVWRHRRLSLELIRRDLGSQFSGQAIGGLWIIAHPLVMFGVYIFLFTVVLKVRIATNLEMPRDYATYILSGLAPWLASQLVLARAPTALSAQANIVKQVVFPIEVLPVGVLAAAAVPLLTGLTVILAWLFTHGEFPVTLVLLPLVVVLHAAFLLGIAYALSAITPFFRDVKDIVSVVSVIGVYLIPAFYLPQWVPQALRGWLYLNPFSYIVWMYQDCLYFGAVRHPEAWAVSAVLAFFGLAIGMRAFKRLKPFVANVL